MIDALSARSLYKQLEGLEATLTHVKGGVANEWMAAFTNQQSFNHILQQISEQCADAPDYLRSLSHITPANIPPGGDRSVYPRFLAQVQMLKNAIGALLEYAPPEERKYGF
jgi:hypothetical protein